MRRLYTRIFAYMLVMLVTVTLVVWAVSFGAFRGELRRGFGHRLTAVGAVLIGEHFDDVEQRRALIARIGRELDVDLTLRDLDGNLLAASGEPLPPVDARDPRLRSRHESMFMRGPRPFTAAIVSRPGDEQPVGVLEAAMPMAMPPVLTHFLQLGAVLLVIALVAALLARRVTRPVSRLTEATLRLGGGDLGYRIPLGQKPERDELGRLELAWNDMAGRIETLVGSHRELLANVSHELRSPLSRLRVVLELLPESPDVRARTTEIERELEDLDRLVEALLTVARLEAAALPVAHETVDATALLEAVRARSAELSGVLRSPLRVDVEAGLELVGDEALLRRALWNLVENAGKYGAPPVTLFARREGDRVRLGVEDDGPGIEPAERERVLAPFVRGATSGKRGGFGLGLTLASRIAAAHGGGLVIEAGREGRGCRVSLVAPAAGG